MSFSTTHVAARFSCFSRGLSALALGIAAAACGGGGDEGAVVAAADASAQASPAVAMVPVARKVAAPRSVVVEGCVLDRHYIPTTGTPVRALASDGRLLGNAQSDSLGRFTLRLPAQGEVLLQIDRPQGESLVMRVETVASNSGICLLDDQA